MNGRSDPRQRLEDAAFERHWLEQVRRGLALTPAERLAWLETTMSELADWVGRARQGHVIGVSRGPVPRPTSPER